jgi:ERF superfamily
MTMERSSPSIGAIAAALAKAQAELTNPEKSLTATIRSLHPREADRSFRYAALSSGLDIVRKSLGRHEIAIVQTTSIDGEAGFIRLATMLAHSSGEWLSSEWPVCAMADTASPRRMGAALTYARRYALFTLVGIAGEDDLDAPDLEAASSEATRHGSVPEGEPKQTIANEPDAWRSEQQYSAGVRLDRRRRKGSPTKPAIPIMEEGPSAILRDRLVLEADALSSADEAAFWAKNSLPTKNTLIPPDALEVEARFATRIAVLEANLVEASLIEERLLEGVAPSGNASKEPGKDLIEQGSAPDPIPARPLRQRIAQRPIRLRDKEHRKFVAGQPCLLCGRIPADPHHLRFAQPRALGRKVSDEFTVPVCRLHHQELHRRGDEAAWWGEAHIDPIPIALTLWRQSHGGERESDQAGGEPERPAGGSPPANKADQPGGKLRSIDTAIVVNSAGAQIGARFKEITAERRAEPAADIVEPGAHS